MGRAYHPWSCNGTDFSSAHLYKFLVDVVIPLKDEKVVPDEPPVDLPAPPEMPSLGTTSFQTLSCQPGNCNVTVYATAQASGETLSNVQSRYFQ